MKWQFESRNFRPSATFLGVFFEKNHVGMTFWMIHGRTGDQARTYFMLSYGDAQYRYNAKNRERKY